MFGLMLLLAIWPALKPTLKLIPKQSLAMPFHPTLHVPSCTLLVKILLHSMRSLASSTPQRWKENPNQSSRPWFFNDQWAKNE